jgi:hypothetical protein
MSTVSYMSEMQMQWMRKQIADLEAQLEKAKKDLKEVISTHPDYGWAEEGPIIMHTPGRGKQLIEKLKNENMELMRQKTNDWTLKHNHELLRDLGRYGGP